MKFYDCSTSPSPRRVRIFLAEKGVEVETVDINLRNREQMREEFIRLNPWATVPVLQLDGGILISEAIACCRYLEAAYPTPPLMGRGPAERGVIAMWEHRVELDGFFAAAEYLRNTAERMRNRALTGRIDYAQIPALAERGKLRVEQFHNFLDERLGESRFVATADYTVADITAQVAIDFAVRMGLPVPGDKANIARWYEVVNSRPSARL